MKDITSWTGVVTGAGSGIGRAAAMALAERGMSVVVSDVDVDRAEDAAGAIVASGHAAIGLQCDATSTDALEHVRARAEAEFGPVDFVMNNVGVLAIGSPVDLPLEEWERALEVNVMSAVRSNDVFLKGLIDRGRGHIVNTASTSGLYPYSYDRIAYSATKHAMVGMTQALYLFARPRGVGVSLLCPGPVLTNIVEGIRTYGPPSSPRPPDLPLATAEEVGELVADAVVDDRFFVVTAPELHDFLLSLAADRDEFLGRAAAGIAADDGLEWSP